MIIIIESEKINKYFGLDRKLIKVKVKVIPVIIGGIGTVSKSLEKDWKNVGNQRKNRDHSEHTIVKIGLTTQKSLGGMRRLAVLQTPEKTRKE